MAIFDPPPPRERLAAVLGAARSERVDQAGPGEAIHPSLDPPTVPLITPAAGPGPVDRGRRFGAEPGRFHVLLDRLRPGGWRGARVDPGRRGAAALALVAVAAAVLAAVMVWTDRPRAEPIGGLPTVSALAVPTSGATASASPGITGPAGPGAPPAPPAARLVVNVSGKVRSPGLVELAEGDRVADALAAAGGALPGTDLSRLNLARRVRDGEQVAVGVPAAPDAAPAPAAADAGGGSAAPGAPAGGPVARLDLNAATAGQLDGLPGVGPVTAQRIIEWRTRNGRFARVDQLREIEGIGERRFGQLRDLVTV